MVCGMVAYRMAKKVVEVKCLEHRDAWKLFEETVGERLIGSSSSDEIHSQANKLVKKCRGLPLALIDVGTAMRSKTSDQWQRAASSRVHWENIRREVLFRLNISLDMIRTDEKLRTCLLYCSLYPEDYPINRDWIIDYCIGEGIIGDSSWTVSEMYSTGHELLDQLEDKLLLESCADDENRHIKMHPMIRCTVLWTVSECGKLKNKCLVIAGQDETMPPLPENWRGAERISLMRNKLEELWDKPECPDLVTLFLHHNPRLKKICDGFFNYMVKLRVLDLSHTRITELPAGIEVLSELQYIDLCGTKITALPSELRMLQKLRFLLLSYTPSLRCIPDGVIKNLLELQVLYLHYSYGDWKVGSIGSGVPFDELNQLTKLKALGITIKSILALYQLQALRLSASLCKLYVRDCPGLTNIQPSTIHGRFTNLKWLRMSDCDDLVVIDANYRGGSSSWPQKVIFENLRNAKIIWDYGCLENLCYLRIQGCDNMEQLLYCKYEEIDQGHEDDNGSKEGEKSGSVPHLKKMELIELPMLKSLTCGRRRLAFGCLEIVEVLACPGLKELELEKGKLREVRGSKPWWDGLQWKDDATKSAFAPLFREK